MFQILKKTQGVLIIFIDKINIDDDSWGALLNSSDLDKDGGVFFSYLG